MVVKSSCAGGSAADTASQPPQPSMTMGGRDGKADEDDAELDEVGHLVGDHAAEGGVEDHDEACRDERHVGGDAQQRGDNAAGGGDLRGGQAEQRQNGQHGGDGARNVAETAADDLGNRHGHGLADLGREVGQRNHGDGCREHVPHGTDAPLAVGALRQTGGGAAADVVGGQRERHEEQTHAATSHHVVIAALDVELADDEADRQHHDEVDANDHQRLRLQMHLIPSSLPWYRTQPARCNKKLLHLREKILSRV